MNSAAKKAKDISNFNKLLDELLVYLENAFKKIADEEDVIKIRMYRNGLSLLRKANARMVVENFWYYVGSHEQQIYDHDSHYFLDSDFVSLGFKKDDNETLQDGLRLKKLWESDKINTEIKDDIWACLETLVSLAASITNRAEFFRG